jgi:ERF superfamily
MSRLNRHRASAPSAAALGAFCEFSEEEMMADETLPQIGELAAAPALAAGEIPLNSGPVPRHLALKLSQVLGALQRIPKLGHNVDQDYDFVRESDCADAVRAELSKVGVFIFSTIEQYTREAAYRTQSGKQMWLYKLWVSYTFIEGEHGERWTVHYPGEAMDFSDKGLYKAITGSMKYFLLKEFLLSSGDDPETGSHEEPGRAAQQKAGPKGKAGAPPAGASAQKTQPAATSELHQQALQLVPLIAKLCALDRTLTPDGIIREHFRTKSGKALTWAEVRDFSTPKQFRWIVGGIAAIRKTYQELLAKHPAESGTVDISGPWDESPV